MRAKKKRVKYMCLTFSDFCIGIFLPLGTDENR